MEQIVRECESCKHYPEKSETIKRAHQEQRGGYTLTTTASDYHQSMGIFLAGAVEIQRQEEPN